ncbi:phage tail length tape measure family protein [Pacificispira spongiicola]|uniref:phage tail length tape measure family protein n=1 Tax=Pacificispira spongiicola TaxID=2729598 RepID=UPI00146F1218|nr:phage tail length tape measure family protein [Pacificispira spongiicola]
MERFDRNMKASGVIVDTVATGMDKATKRAATSFNRLEGALNPAAAATRRYERDVQRVKTALDSGVVSNERAAQVLSRLGDQYERASQTGSNMTRSLGQSARGSRQMGMAIQQAGYQVGDFAVQVASGQNPLRAFIQQGTQLVSMFGPWGAVIGAAGAVVGALVTAFWESNEAAETATDKIDAFALATQNMDSLVAHGAKSLGEMRTAFSQLDSTIREIETVKIQTQIDTTRAAMRALAVDASQYRKSIEDISDLSFMPSSESGPVLTISDDAAQFESQIKELSKSIEAARKAGDLEAAQAMLKRLNEIQELQRRLDALQNSLETLGGGGKEFGDGLSPEKQWDRVKNVMASTQGVNSLTTGGPSPESQAVFDRANASTDRYRDTLERLKKAMEDGKAVELSVRTEREQHADTLERLDRLLMQGAISQETYNRAAQNANRTLMQSDPVLSTVAHGLDSTTTGLFRFGDAAESNAERVRNALVGMLNDISEEFGRRALTNPLLNLLFDAGLPTLTGLFSGGGGINIASNALASGSVLPPSLAAGLFHSGGIVGSGGVQRDVPAALFAEAPRYHSGGVVMPGEVPAILKRDEEVLTRSDPRHRYNFGRGSGAASGPTFNIDARGADRQGMAELSATVRALNGKINRIDATLEPRAVKSMVDTRRRNPKIFSG